MKRKATNVRILLIGIGALIAFFLVSYNVYSVTVKGVHNNSKTDITAYSNSANTKTTTLHAKRGNIYDRNGNIIAQDQKTYTLVAILDKNRPNSSSRPAYVDDKVRTSEVLSQVLNVDQMEILKILEQDKYQVEFGMMGRNLSTSKKEEIESYELPGIEFRETTSRFYPQGLFSSHIIGFATYDDETGSLSGKMGIEQIRDEILKGEDGYTKVQINTEGYTLPGSLSDKVDAKEGSDVYLTLDKTIQEQLQISMNKTIEMFNAELVWGTVMETNTGKILAMGSSNDFDLNQRQIDDYTNIITQYAYEPGSVMKTFTYAAAIDSGVYHGGDTFNSKAFQMGIENGKPVRVTSGSNKTVYATINNSRNRDWGTISYDLGYRYSSNVGIASILSNYLNNDVFASYLDKFGFFKKVDFEGFAEVTGIRNILHPIDLISTGFGQASSVTMIQMLQAYTAIFNNGEMVKPYLVEQITNSATHETIYAHEKEVVGNPITAATAKRVQKLMSDVVNTDDGSGRHYATNEVKVIGKTGTAQYAEHGSYNTGKVITSVVLGFPEEDPKIMVYYAFLSRYETNLHTDTDPITDLVKKVALTCNLTEPETSISENKETDTVEIYTMDNYLNHSIDYVKTKMEGKNLTAYVLGDGDTVIKQYPEEGTTIVSSQPVFLLTSETNIAMPNVLGYNRKDLIALWDMIHLAVSIQGEGEVIYQSIEPGTLIYSNSLLEVVLK